jgi:acetyl-CoA carboxylase biotin carboxyl carrier protein
MKYTTDELYGLVKKLSELHLKELTVKNEDLTIKIKSGHGPAIPKTAIYTQDGNTEEQAYEAAPEEKPGKVIAAPINGTFYCASGPDEEPYIKEGDSVKKGEPICILEAMKMMNTINMPEDGVILSVEVANEDIVDAGQPLVRYDAV